MLKKFHQDMERIGLRLRRQHDLRRTFISLCLGDGASKDILRWITHAPEGDVVDDYTTLVWQPLCREVAKLQISLPKSEPIVVAKSAISQDPVTSAVTRPGAETRNPSQTPDFAQDFETGLLRGGRDLNTRPDLQPGEVTEQSGANYGHLRVVGGAGELPAQAVEQSTCHTVTRKGTVGVLDWVEVELSRTLERWRGNHDERALRAALGRLIAVL
jgi:hypothetical protein